MTARIRGVALGLVFFLLSIPPLWAQTPRPKTFSSGPATLTYYEMGPRRGTPLVLLSGGPGFDPDYFWFGRAFQTLAQTRWVLTYDQRGTGQSTRVGPADSVTVADYVADLEALRVALGVEKIDVLGHSWGGYLALAYGAAHGDRIAHMVLVGSAAPKFSDTIFLFTQVFPERDMSTPMAKGMAGDSAALAQAIGVYTSMIFYSPSHGVAWRKLGSRLKFNPDVNRHLSRDLARQDFTPSLKEFRFPTLVTTGRYDMNVAPLTAFRIHQAIPSSEFRVFEESSHIPFYEEPDAFVAALKPFLAR